VIASDVHLSAADPVGVARFVAFLEGPAASAERVVIAGDLFDVWTTPGQAREPGLAPVFDALRRLAARTDVGFIEGNRDFAATPELRAAGVRRLDDVLVLDVHGRRVIVTHGDLLCSRDVRYQAFRRLVRTSTVRHLLRRAPTGAARGAGAAARRGSAMETASKPYGDMGLAPAAVASLLRLHDADALVCGHVHWGERFRVDVDGRDRDVVVLSAWEDVPTFARLDADGLAFERFAPPSPGADLTAPRSARFG
jgi:UDP-2,3-diacylglucosamine hydrolase